MEQPRARTSSQVVGTSVGVLVLAAGLPSCSCEGDTFTGGSSSLAVDTPSIQLGRVFIGTSARATLVLSAPGVIPVTYATRLEGDTFGYQLGPAVGRLPPNGAVEIVVVFRPGVQGPATARAVFESDATRTATVGVELFGFGVTPPDCEDGNGCTVDTFDLDKGECIHSAERLSCDDFNACTQGDVCVEAICLGESTSCDDHDVCTDDLCDPHTGCTHVPTRFCNDQNPCTLDTCDPVGGCQHQVLTDGTPCDDFEQCTIADICLAGRCIGVNIPEGTMCDDLDPCSKNDQCIEGECRDPTYLPPAIGGIKFATDVGTLAERASENPIIDRDSTTFVGVEGGVAAVDLCGELLWTNLEIGTPRFNGAASLPGIISVPVGSRIVDLDTEMGGVLRSNDLADLFPALSSSTATASVHVLDLAVRRSGALVASVLRETSERGEIRREGLVAEIDRSHSIASRFRDLGTRHASRLAIDADEAVIAVLRDGGLGEDPSNELLVRFGVNGLPETSWSVSGALATHTEIALGAAGEVLWSASGLTRVGRAGGLLALIPPTADLVLPVDAGSPVTTAENTLWVRAIPDLLPAGGFGLSGRGAFDLVALEGTSGVVSWSTRLPAPAQRMSPAVDLAGNVYVMTSDGVLHSFHGDGQAFFTTPLLETGEPIHGVAVGISPDKVVVVVAGGRVIGVQSMSSLGSSSWPRHRRDNLATGHK